MAATTLLLAGLVLSGCEETRYVQVPVPTPAPSSSNPPPTPPEETPEEPTVLTMSLNSLGVSTTDSPRLSNQGVPMPQDHSPFGTLVHARVDGDGNVHFGAPMELAMLGFSLHKQDSFLTVTQNLHPGPTGAVAPTLLHRRTAIQAPWAKEDRGFEEEAPLTQRAMAAGDIDGDGLSEIVIVRLESGQVLLETLKVNDESPSETQLLIAPPVVGMVSDVRIATGDFDGDRRWEIAVALSGPRMDGQRNNTAILLLDTAEPGYEIVHMLVLESTLSRVHVTPVLEGGNVDYDAAHELVVVLNEIDLDHDALPAQAATRMLVFDDASADFAQIFSHVPGVTAGNRVANVADVAIGDFDDDDQNEIVAAGLSGLAAEEFSCNLSGIMRYVAVLYEFDGQTLAPAREAASHVQDNIYPAGCQNDGNWIMRFVYVNAVDLDGDRDHELQINQFVFSAFPDAGMRWTAAAAPKLAELPRTVLFLDQNMSGQVFDRHSGTIEVGDVTGDGRDDIVSYRAGNDEIEVFSLTHEGGFHRSARMPVETADAIYGTGFPRAVNPQLLAFNGDLLEEDDVLVLRFNRHYLEFTESIVLAALAAPPCIGGGVQKTDACVTSWGRSETTSVEGEREFKFSAGIVVGTEFSQSIPLVGTQAVQFEFKLALEREAARVKSESYEVSKSVSFETGPQEDSVVYASIPYDVYEYEQVARTGDSDEAPVTYRISLPREAVIRIATTSYYNAHTLSRALKIDERVFAHRVGDVASYPTLQDRDRILSERRSQLELLRIECPFCWQADPENPVSLVDGPFRSFDPIAALPGLYSRAIGVGQGSGATEVGIELNVSNGNGRALETGFECAIEGTVSGISAGVQFGAAAGTGTMLTRSEGTSYIGTVGSIPGEAFTRNQYKFGLFTYLQADPNSGIEFEVINYWVE